MKKIDSKETFTISLFKKVLIPYLLVMGLYETIAELWRALKLLLLGKIVPRKADTVISLVLSVLLYRKLGLTAGREP